MQYKGWEGFIPGKWSEDEVDVRDFIQRNYTPYEGDSSFLAPPTEATKKLWDIVLDLSKKEREAGGVLDADTKIVSTLTSHAAGYLDKDLEKIVGLQTDKPFKRSLPSIPKSKKSLRNTARRTTTASMTLILPKCARRVRRIFSRDFPIPTAAAVSSATIAEWLCTAWTISFVKRKRINSP